MLVFVVLALSAAAPPVLRVEPGQSPDRVEVVAVLTGRLLAAVPAGVLTREQGERCLRLGLIDPDSGAVGPPIFGSYRRDGSTLRFTPRHALTPGETYRATFDASAGRVERTHRVATERPVVPQVVAVYPGSDVLPANQLKFYLHFSRPMREGRAIFDHIRLLDERGVALAEPWRRTELWSADGQRLTLWIHPGRIKRGVGLREAEGPVLQANRRYTLEVGAALCDTAGTPLGQPRRKEFRTVDDDRRRPLPEQWQIGPVRAGTRAVLQIDFPEPLDRALLDRCLTIHDRDGRVVPGRIEVSDRERRWRFTPDGPWASVAHRLLVDADLEDLAGNTPVRLFDVDLRDPRPDIPRLTLPFRPIP